MVQPKNGLYLDKGDFKQWQDYFSPLIESENKLINNKCTSNCSSCGLCEQTYENTKDPDLRVKNITFVVTERCNLNCKYCIAGDSLITMSDFTEKPIKDIKIGDKILAFEELQNIFNIEASVEQIHHRKSKVITIVLENSIKIKITKNHLVLCNHLKNKLNFRYNQAGNLIIGDFLYCINSISNNIEYKKIVDIIDEDEEIDVYNLGTSTRTYIANNILVHNCYEKHKTGKRMTKQIAKDAVDFIFNKEKVNEYFNSEKSPAVILEFIGGEPLLEIDIMDYIVEYFKFKAFSLNHPWATNYMINFTSNGVLFENEKVQAFLNRNKGRVSIGITIDGNKELHDSCRVFPDGSGSYDIVEKSVKRWLENDAKPQTKITLAPSNIKYLNDALKNVWSLGIVGALTNCVFEEGWTTEHASILYNEMIKLADYLLENENYKKYYTSLFDKSIGVQETEDRNWCGGNGQMLAISPEGKCFPCIRFMKYSLSTPNRLEQSIGDIYNGLDKKEDNEWLNKLKNITMTSQCQYEDNKKCLSCPISKGCSLCTGYNYDKFGNPNHKATFICEMHQARVMANYYYWTKLYKLLKIDEKFNLNMPKEWILKIITEKEYKQLINI